MRAIALSFVIVAALLDAGVALAATARDLSGRIRIDGRTDDFTADETMFGIDSLRALPQELSNDSRWGVNNDLNQIRVTWDAQNLYLAGEGKIWGNNMLLWLDTVPGRGILTMAQLNSWRRNFNFESFNQYAGDEFAPDVFGATWDGNSAPRWLTHVSGNQVDDQLVGTYFNAAASFLSDADGRAMEFAVPWAVVFALRGGVGTRDTTMTVNGITETFRRMPIGVHSIKIAGAITGGGDGTGGPDSAPDNLRGHEVDGNAQVIIDNFAVIELDVLDDTGLGRGGPDGIPDWGVEPHRRVSFRFPPPIEPKRFSFADVTLDRPVIAPDRGERMTFRIGIEPPVDPNDPVDSSRLVEISANVFDARGRRVRDLFPTPGSPREIVPALDVNTPLRARGLSQWDGRDDEGRLVPPGIYVLRVVIEPNSDRATRAFVVVR